jgi:serine/threonine-protein kinase RsbW
MKELVSLTLPGRLENLARFSGAVVDAARDFGVAEPRLAAVELALEETLVNIFTHAFPDGDGEVTVTCTGDAQQPFEIRIEDEGPPFDLLQQERPDTTAGIDDRQPGGLGIHLIRQMMQEVMYRREAGKNIIVLIP